MPAPTDSAATAGLSLAPFRATRYAVPDARLGSVLCPPYDVIDAAERRALLDRDPANAVRLVLPVGPGEVPSESAYRDTASAIDSWLADGTLDTDDQPALYVYEVTDTDGSVMRGLVGAVELHDPEDGVILPHENTMAGPVADRLALMDATDANLEPIYLVYDGGGAASEVVADVASNASLCDARTPDGLRHRLWAITDAGTLAAIADDLGTRRALIADGHHRYATYRRLQADRRADGGPGPWDRGLALVVDTSTYGPRVHPIHRVLPGLSLDDALTALPAEWEVERLSSPADADTALTGTDPSGFTAVLVQGDRAVRLGPAPQALIEASRIAGEPEALAALDVTVLHRVLVGRIWNLTDDEAHVEYAHSAADAVQRAADTAGVAVLLRATPVAAVATVAAAGARMPRKSTLFTPKPASGLVVRRFADS